VKISSNGVHLTLRCALKNNDENVDLVKRFLQAIDMLFSDEKVDCDVSLFNAARILKAAGTWSVKGNDNPNSDRPRRMAKYVKIPEDWYKNINDIAYFQKVADMLPEKEQPDRTNNYKPNSFDLDAFIQQHNIKIAKVVKTAKMTKYLLEECPFCHSKSPDSALFVMPDGSKGFRCLHNRCQHLGFKDFRLFYDPTSYDRKEYAEYQQRQLYYGNIRREPFRPIAERDGKPKWLSLKDVEYIDMSKLTTLNTGYIELDKKCGGLLLGDVTILSGISGAGKTSWLDCCILNVIDKGTRVAVWSGEMQSWRFQQWIAMVGAGRPYVKKKDGYDDFWYCPKQISEKVCSWLDDKLYLYNCEEYGSRFAQIFSDIQDVVEYEHVQLVVIDNLAALNISDLDGSRYEQQTQFITEVKDYAKKQNIAVIIVCHPRKVVSFLRKEDVAGSADLVNLCDNLWILHRVGKDFEQRASQFLDKMEVERMKQYDTVLEVCKNRMMGVTDYLIGMYYEKESRRLKNTRAEHLIYGWADERAEQQTMEMMPDEPLPETPFAAPDDNEEVPF
jgi:archaellum biogenesis ATPase FlaH